MPGTSNMGRVESQCCKGRYGHTLRPKITPFTRADTKKQRQMFIDGRAYNISTLSKFRSSNICTNFHYLSSSACF